MTIRTTTEVVTFKRPFLLASIGEEQPAGRYTVETDEELLEGASMPAYRRIATLMRLPGRPGSTVVDYVVDIDASELAAALQHDADGEIACPAMQESAMEKDHIEIRCPHCGQRTSIEWPTSRKRHAQVTCAHCKKDFPMAEAVERTVIGTRDERDLHIAPDKPGQPE